MSETDSSAQRGPRGPDSIERELGEGGMATVYLAEAIKHERKVALKVLKPELAAVIGGERFVTEIRTTPGVYNWFEELKQRVGGD